MKKTYLPKLLFPLLQLLFGLGLLTLIIYGLNIFRVEFKIELLIQGIIFFAIIGFFSLHLIYNFFYYVKIIRFEGNFITIFELHKLKSTKIDYKEIEGFSTSEVYFGRYLWKSKSIVIYTKTKKTIEILNSYNSSFEKFEFELRKRKVKYYGFEEYNTGWYFREYKFNRK